MVKKKRKNSIYRTQLYAQLITMLISMTLIAGIFFGIQVKSMQNSMKASLAQTSKTIALNVEMALQRIDSISINILYSNLIKESFIDSFNSKTGKKKVSKGASVDEIIKQNSNAETLTNMLLAVMGADKPVKQINLYNNDGGCFGTGIYNGFYDENAQNMPWFAQAKAKAGKRYITAPSENEMLSKRQGGRPVIYISIVRQYFDVYNQPQGFVEIIQTCDNVFSITQDVQAIYTLQTVIYDAAGLAVFPYENKNEFLPNYINSRNGNEMVQVYNKNMDKQEFIMFSDMSNMGFTAAVVLDSSEYYAQVWQFFVISVIMCLGLVLAFCIVAYFTNKQISQPISQMYEYLSTIEIDENTWKRKLKIKSSGIWEIDVLQDSINSFQSELKKSTENILLLQKQDLQSQMLALQSQMNPHFLYNSMSTISAMAQEGLTEEISTMCEDITHILRYISTNKNSFVRLEEELETCAIYLSSLQLRFGKSLNYEFEIQDEMLDMLIPKLSVQMLVENAVKYMAPTNPPWFLSVKGTTDTNSWAVQVKDNGVGFSDEVLEKLLAKMHEIDKNGLMPSLELSGMGLLNIYVRLHLLYGNGHIFKFSNRKQRGAVISIGGKVTYETGAL